MTSETVYSVELVSRMTYLNANSLGGTYTGTLRRNVPWIPVTTGECPFSVRLADDRIGRKVLLGVLSRGHEIASIEGPACGVFLDLIAIARYR